MENEWMNHPKLEGIDKSKLEMLQGLANQDTQKGPSDLMPFLMAAASQGKSQEMKFSPQEMGAIIEVIKMGKSPEEIARLDKIINIMQMMRF